MSSGQQDLEVPSAGLCPYQRTIHLVREKWTLLVLRAMMTRGATHVDDFLAIPDMGPEILRVRLASLVTAGVLNEVDDHPRDVRYSLSEPGLRLMVILRALGQWADEYNPSLDTRRK